MIQHANVVIDSVGIISSMSFRLARIGGVLVNVIASHPVLLLQLIGLVHGCWPMCWPYFALVRVSSNR